MMLVEKFIVLVVAFFLSPRLFAACGVSERSLTPSIRYSIKCNEKQCTIALYDGHEYHSLYACDTEDEFLQYVKSKLNRTIPKGKYSVFQLKNIANSFEKNMIRVGCDFLKVSSLENVDSLTAILKPEKEGVCPILLNTKYSNGFYNAVVSKRNSKWNIRFDPNYKYESDLSEFTFYQYPIPLFVDKCKKNKCRFFVVENLPFPRSSYQNAVLVTNLSRILPQCSFVRVKDDVEKIGSGFFTLSNVGKCSVVVKYRDGTLNEKVLNVTKENDVFNIEVVAKK